jgi:hypothetical protein
MAAGTRFYVHLLGALFPPLKEKEKEKIFRNENLLVKGGEGEQ